MRLLFLMLLALCVAGVWSRRKGKGGRRTTTTEEPGTTAASAAASQTTAACDVESQIASSGLTLTVNEDETHVTVETTCYPPEDITSWYPIPKNGDNMPSDENVKTFVIPLQPQKATSPTHFRKGVVGITHGGMCIYDECTSSDMDAMQTESFDDCTGHSDPNGFYHFHGKPQDDSSCPCDFYRNNTAYEDLPRELGWALDGFAIVSNIYPNLTEVDDSWLDACHGIQFKDDYYAYVVQGKEGKHPYSVGCFVGTPDLKPHAIETTAHDCIATTRKREMVQENVNDVKDDKSTSLLVRLLERYLADKP